MTAAAVSDALTYSGLSEHSPYVAVNSDRQYFTAASVPAPDGAGFINFHRHARVSSVFSDSLYPAVLSKGCLIPDGKLVNFASCMAFSGMHLPDDVASFSAAAVSPIAVSTDSTRRWDPALPGIAV